MAQRRGMEGDFVISLVILYRSGVSAALTLRGRLSISAPFEFPGHRRASPMKVKSSLKALKTRHRDCKVVRRRGRVYVINKTDPRFKAKQG